jgi:hypothetical protein
MTHLPSSKRCSKPNLLIESRPQPHRLGSRCTGVCYGIQATGDFGMTNGLPSQAVGAQCGITVSLHRAMLDP